ncbi:MAG: apolipoprotein N-acyltransferase [Halopseudomonas sp.]|uniref:apolipoprotein N-acyltransferase n=1 Tax=Halopseudomonas sp. TaxID=2901191 RepID=UPI003002ACA1
MSLRLALLPRALLARLRGPGLTGHLIAVAAGALSTLAFAPYNLWPFALLSIALLYQSLLQLDGRQAALRGLAWGLGLFVSGVSWIYISIHLHGNASPLLAGFLTGGLEFGLSLLIALWAWVWVRFLRSGNAWSDSLSFAAIWVVQEMFRGWFLTGFPWLYQGYAYTHTWLSGWAPLGGVWLLGALAVCSACLLSEWRLLRRPAQAGMALLLIASFWLGGLALQQVNWTQPKGEPLSVNLVQANIEQSLKWDPDYITHTLSLYRDLTYAQPATDLVVWPETAVPVLQSQSQYFVDGIAANLAERGSTLITGIPVDEMDPEGLRIYNGITVGGSQPQSQYLKQKLVPFGEYVPLEALLRGLIDFFNLPMSSFSRGPADQPPLLAAGYRLAPLICYEAVYPDFAAKQAAQSDLLITISNDSWFGRSIGPLQHLQMAQMRAIEAQRWMIRATNNGVTALIDPHGAIRARIPQFQQEVLIGEVQPMQGLTPYLRWRSAPLGLVTVSVLLIVALRRRRQNAR